MRLRCVPCRFPTREPAVNHSHVAGMALTAPHSLVHLLHTNHPALDLLLHSALRSTSAVTTSQAELTGISFFTGSIGLRLYSLDPAHLLASSCHSEAACRCEEALEAAVAAHSHVGCRLGAQDVRRRV